MAESDSGFMSRLGWGAAVGGVLAGVAGAGYALERRTVRRWRTGDDEVAAAGLLLPDDVVEHRVPTSDGGELFALERGEGPPVVLLHGVTLTADIWPRQFRGLSGAHRVIALDQRGHGRSRGGSEGYGFDRLASDVWEVLEALDLSDAVLVGHSMGTMVVQKLASRDPNQLRKRVTGLVLLAASAGPVIPGPAGGPLSALLAQGIGRGFSLSDRRGRGLFPQDDLASWSARSVFGAGPDPAAVELTRRLIVKMSPGVMAELVGPLFTFDVRSALPAIDLPTAVVSGGRDLISPPPMGRAIVRRVRGATFTDLPGCGHMVMLERPDETNQIIEEMVRRGGLAA